MTVSGLSTYFEGRIGQMRFASFIFVFMPGTSDRKIDIHCAERSGWLLKKYLFIYRIYPMLDAIWYLPAGWWSLRDANQCMPDGRRGLRDPIGCVPAGRRTLRDANQCVIDGRWRLPDAS